MPETKGFRRQLLHTMSALVLFNAALMLLYAATHDWLKPDNNFSLFLLRLGNHSSVLVPIVMLSALLLLLRVVFRFTAPSSFITSSTLHHLALLSTLFFLTFFPTGNILKFNTLYFESWMWLCAFWLVSLIFVITAAIYLIHFHAKTLERIGQFFLPVSRYIMAQRSHSFDKWFLALAPLWILLTTFFFSHFILGGIPHVQDEIAQIFQAKLFSYGQLSFPTPEHAEFFERLYVVNRDNRWYTIYPPGFALLYAWTLFLHVSTFINPITSVGIFLLFFFFIKKNFSLPIARVSCFLMLFSPFFIIMGSGWMNHPSSLLFLLLFLTFLRNSVDGQVRRKRDALFSGLAFSVAFIIRPLTALAFLFAGAVWYLSFSAFQWRKILTTVSLFGAATLPAAGLYFAYNSHTTGDPFLTGYTQYFGGNPMGFGKRPWRVEPDVPKIPREVNYTPLYGAANLQCNLNGMNYYLFGFPVPSLFLLFFLFTPMAKRNRMDWLSLSCIVSVCFIYFFYFYQDLCYGPRFLYETLPFFIVLSARGLQELLRWIRKNSTGNQTAAYGLAYLFLTFFFVWAFSTTWVERSINMSDRYWTTPEDTAHLALATVMEQNAILFVEDGEDYAALFPFLDPKLEEGWIVALDLGREKNRELLQEYPGWNAYHVKIVETGPPVQYETVVVPYE